MGIDYVLISFCLFSPFQLIYTYSPCFADRGSSCKEVKKKEEKSVCKNEEINGLTCAFACFFFCTGHAGDCYCAFFFPSKCVFIIYVIIKCSAIYSCQLDTFFMSQILYHVCVTGCTSAISSCLQFCNVCVIGCSSAISSCVQFCNVCVCYWLYFSYFFLPSVL